MPKRSARPHLASHRLGFRLLLGLCVLALVLQAKPARSDDKGKDQKDPPLVLKGDAAEELVRLKREVDALETLYHLEPTKAQLNVLLGLAQKTAAKPPVATEASATAGYRQALLDLRTALTKDDEEQVTALYQKLAEIEDATPVKIADEFEITDAAMKSAPAALKVFTAAQIVSYLTAMDSEVPDPVERILITFSEGEELKGEQWIALRDETAEEVAWLLHGFNADAAKGTTKAVVELLDRGHRLKPDDLKKEMDALEKAARKIAADVSPVTVLQHFMERELAELLSNPRAVAAIKARLDAIKK